MGPKARQTKQQLDEELEHHIANDWADFRRFAPKKEIVLHEAILCFSEGPFWGCTIPSVPHWYLDYLCSGGENFLLWKDEDLAAALSKKGYRKVDVPPMHAPGIPPVASLLWPKVASPGPLKTIPKTAAETDSELMPPPPRPSSATRTPDYSALANMARDPADKQYLLTADDATEAAAGGPGLHLQSELDVSSPSTACAIKHADCVQRSRSYDAAIKRMLFGFRNLDSKMLDLH
ncbi:hypothetical protein P171DRAFT_434680, partial [Karstenula rhodostoma CBS 690.94]